MSKHLGKTLDALQSTMFESFNVLSTLLVSITYMMIMVSIQVAYLLRSTMRSIKKWYDEKGS